jgi:hypothetical protein
MADPTDPKNYVEKEIGGRILLECRDCGRRSGFNDRAVPHGPRCDYAPRRTTTVAFVSPNPVAAEAYPKLLPTGEWGAFCKEGSVKVGDEIRITTKAGKNWTAQVSEILRSEESGCLVRTSSGADAAVRAGLVVSDDDVFDAFQRGAISINEAMNRDF